MTLACNRAQTLGALAYAAKKSPPAARPRAELASVRKVGPLYRVDAFSAACPGRSDWLRWGRRLEFGSPSRSQSCLTLVPFKRLRNLYESQEVSLEF